MPACNFDSYSNFAKARFHIQNLVRAMYFAGFAISPRNSPHCRQNQKPPFRTVLKLWCEQRGTHLTIFSQFFNPFDRFLPAFLSVCLTLFLALFKNNAFFAKCKVFFNYDLFFDILLNLI